MARKYSYPNLTERFGDTKVLAGVPEKLHPIIKGLLDDMNKGISQGITTYTVTVELRSQSNTSLRSQQEEEFEMGIEIISKDTEPLKEGECLFTYDPRNRKLADDPFSFYLKINKVDIKNDILEYLTIDWAKREEAFQQKYSEFLEENTKDFFIMNDKKFPYYPYVRILPNHSDYNKIQLKLNSTEKYEKEISWKEIILRIDIRLSTNSLLGMLEKENVHLVFDKDDKDDFVYCLKDNTEFKLVSVIGKILDKEELENLFLNYNSEEWYLKKYDDVSFFFRNQTSDKSEEMSIKDLMSQSWSKIYRN